MLATHTNADHVVVGFLLVFRVQVTGSPVCPIANSFGSQALLRNFAAGEARLDVADAALQIGAEDDALVSHSPVALPVPCAGPRCQSVRSDQTLEQPSICRHLESVCGPTVPCTVICCTALTSICMGTVRQVDAFKGRIARLAGDLSRNHLPQLPPDAPPEAVLQARIPLPGDMPRADMDVITGGPACIPGSKVHSNPFPWHRGTLQCDS